MNIITRGLDDNQITRGFGDVEEEEPPIQPRVPTGAVTSGPIHHIKRHAKKDLDLIGSVRFKLMLEVIGNTRLPISRRYDVIGYTTHNIEKTLNLIGHIQYRGDILLTGSLGIGHALNIFGHIRYEYNKSYNIDGRILHNTRNNINLYGEQDYTTIILLT